MGVWGPVPEGDYERAETALATAAAEANAQGERWVAAWAAEELAYSAEHRGDMALTETRAQEALELSRAVGDDWLIAHSMQRLGEAARGREDFPLAAARFRESLALSRHIGEQYSIANALNALGQVAQASGDDRLAAELLRESLALAREVGDKRRCAMCLEGLAGVGLHAGRSKATVRLLGLAERLRETVGAQRESVDRARFARHLQAARAALSETEFASAWEQGRSLSLDALPADPLEETGSHARASSGATHADPLTQREHEVALLVARGLTNRAIAAELVMSEATARTHVDHILTKLDLHSRAQIATWATERGLLSPTAT